MPMRESAKSMSPERAPRRARELAGALLLAAALGAANLSCDVALIGGGVAALAAGTGMVAAQCYDQVSVRVRDDEGRRTCDAQVSLLRDGSESPLRPCYHASLTEGRYRVSVQREGYVPADMQLDIPEHKGACPHYTHTIELTLRRTGAPPEPPGFGHPKAPALDAVSSKPREHGTVPAPIPVPTPSAVPAALPSAATPAPAVPEPAPAPEPLTPAPPSATFPPAPAAPSAPPSPPASP
jgi:hypothetical protein